MRILDKPSKTYIMINRLTTQGLSTMTKTRNRKPALINPETADEAFSNLFHALDDADKAVGLSATTLSRSCGTWRKINRYLNMPTVSIERQEAESVLDALGITYKRGAFNSRTFNVSD